MREVLGQRGRCECMSRPWVCREWPLVFNQASGEQVRMTRDVPGEGYFFSALEAFITRTAYANSSGGPSPIPPSLSSSPNLSFPSPFLCHLPPWLPAPPRVTARECWGPAITCLPRSTLPCIVLPRPALPCLPCPALPCLAGVSCDPGAGNDF